MATKLYRIITYRGGLLLINSHDTHCVKSVCIQNYSGRYFPAIGLNTERYEVSLCIQPECGKILTRITPNMGHFLRSDLDKVVLEDDVRDKLKS